MKLNSSQNIEQIRVTVQCSVWSWTQWELDLHELMCKYWGGEQRPTVLCRCIWGVSQVAGCSAHSIPSSLFACQAQLKRVFLEHPAFQVWLGFIMSLVPGLCCVRASRAAWQSTEGTQCLFFWKAKGSSVYPTDAAALVVNRRLIESCLASAEPESNPPSFSSVSLGPKTAECLCLGVVLSICEPYTHSHRQKHRDY